jgi:hypothetical protein
VLWHTHVEQLSAAEVSPLVGRSANEVGELVATAERGLTDAFLREYLDRTPIEAPSAILVSMLGGYVRSSLPPGDQRRIEEHLQQHAVVGDEPSRHTSADTQRLISIVSSLPLVLPPAIAPGITGLSVQQLRRALGTTTRAFSADSMDAARADRIQRVVLVGSAVVVAATLAGAAFVLGQRDESAEPPSSAATSDSVADTPPVTPTETATETPNETANGSTAPTSDVVAPSETTTTTLDLRPSGPANEIALVVNSGARSAGLTTIETGIATTVGVPAPIFAGGSGTLDISLFNETVAPIAANLELMLPNGVTFGGLVGGEASCVDPDDDSPYCDIVVEPGTSRDLSVNLRLESAVVGRVVVGGDSVAKPLETKVVGVSSLVHNSVGRGDVIMIGNTLMGCATDLAAAQGVSCADVQDGTSPIVNRWDVPMDFVGVEPAFGLANSSRAVLELPAGAEVRAAYLFWSGDVNEGGASVAVDRQAFATLATPAGEVVGVVAEELVFGEQDASQYLGRVDVTTAVAAGGAGEYLFGNAVSVQAQGSYGAWSLVVVTDDDALPRRERIVLDPFAWVAPEDSFDYRVAVPTPVLAGATAQLDVLAFEGERGSVQPESLLVGGVDVGGTNPFDSTIVGNRTPMFENNLGVDIDAYDLVIDTPAATLSIEATSAFDGIRVAVLGITVDIAP